MKNARAAVVCLLFLGVLCFSPACEGDNPAGPSGQSICFTVSGFNVNTYNMWRNGTVNNDNVQGLAAFTSTVSSGGESHTLEWTSIVNNYTTFTVTSFSVRIDGRNYSYPANRCS